MIIQLSLAFGDVGFRSKGVFRDLYPDTSDGDDTFRVQHIKDSITGYTTAGLRRSQQMTEPPDDEACGGVGAYLGDN